MLTIHNELGRVINFASSILRNARVVSGVAGFHRFDYKIVYAFAPSLGENFEIRFQRQSIENPIDVNW